MKCMFVIPRMGGGGAERVVSILADKFTENGYKVHIAQLIGNESFYELNKDVTISGLDISIRRNNKIIALYDQARFFLKSLSHIQKNIDTFKPDVVISFLVETSIMMWILRILGSKVKWITSERNDPTRRNIFKRKIMRSVYKKSDCLICQSNRVAEYYNDVDNKRVIPNPIIKYNVPCVAMKDRRKVVVGVGRLDDQKNFSLLIRSFVNVHFDYLDYSLEIYGEGHKRKTLQQLIDKLNANEYIHLLGAYKDVHKQIYDASLFVMSSDYEGFPNALAEAMSIGLPVISTDFFTGVAKDIVKSYNGIVVPVGDELSMIKAMKDLLGDEKIRDMMCLENRKISDKYSASAIAENWKEAIEEALMMNNN